MSLGLQSSIVGLGSIALYLLIAVIFLKKGWLVRAGVAMALMAFLPVLWQINFTDSNAKGFVLQLFLLWPPAILLALAGAGLCVMRWVRQAILRGGN